MSPKNTDTEEIRNRFNGIDWHDSKLVGFSASGGGNGPNGPTDDVCLEIKMLTSKQPGGYQWKDVRLLLKECIFLKVAVDFYGKHVCSDDISTAFCSEQSELKDYIRRQQVSEKMHVKYGEGSIESYLHFAIELIPPGGTIDVFARDFELVGE